MTCPSCLDDDHSGLVARDFGHMTAYKYLLNNSMLDEDSAKHFELCHFKLKHCVLSLSTHLSGTHMYINRTVMLLSSPKLHSEQLVSL